MLSINVTEVWKSILLAHLNHNYSKVELFKLVIGP